MAETNDYRKDFYNSLVNEGYTFNGTTDYEEYEKAMADPDRARKIYNATLEDGWEHDDFDTFYSDYGPQTQNQTENADGTSTGGRKPELNEAPMQSAQHTQQEDNKAAADKANKAANKIGAWNDAANATPVYGMEDLPRYGEEKAKTEEASGKEQTTQTEQATQTEEPKNYVDQASENKDEYANLDPQYQNLNNGTDALRESRYNSGMITEEQKAEEEKVQAQNTEVEHQMYDKYRPAVSETVDQFMTDNGVYEAFDEAQAKNVGEKIQAEKDKGINDYGFGSDVASEGMAQYVPTAKDKNPEVAAQDAIASISDEAFSNYAMSILGLGGDSSGNGQGAPREYSEEEKRILDLYYNKVAEYIASEMTNKLYGRFVQQNAPKNWLEYILSSGFSNSLTNQIINAVKKGFGANPSLAEQLLQRGIQGYDANWLTAGAAGAFGMIVDAPLFGALGGIANPIGKVAGNVAGRVAGNAIGGVMAQKLGSGAVRWTIEAAEKVAGKTVLTNAERLALSTPAGETAINIISGIAQRVAGGAINFSLYEGLAEGVGAYNQGLSTTDVIDAAVDGMAGGAKKGAMLGVFEAIFPMWAQAVHAGKGWRYAAEAGGMAAGATYFTVDELMELGDFSASDAAYIFGKNMAMMGLLKIQNIGSIVKQINAEAGGRSRTSLTEDDYQNINEALGTEYGNGGMSLLYDIFNGKEIADTPENNAKLQDIYTAIQTNPNIPLETKAKLQWMAYGDHLPYAGIVNENGERRNAESVEDAAYFVTVNAKDGVYSVVIMNDGREVVGVRRFKSEKDAKKYADEVNDIAVMNNINATQFATGIGPNVDNNYNVKDGLAYYEQRHEEAVAKAKANVNARSKNGKTIDDVLKKPYSKMDEVDKAMLEDYQNELQKSIRENTMDPAAKQAEDMADPSDGKIHPATDKNGNPVLLIGAGDGKETVMTMNPLTGEKKMLPMADIVAQDEPISVEDAAQALRDANDPNVQAAEAEAAKQAEIEAARQEVAQKNAEIAKANEVKEIGGKRWKVAKDDGGTTIWLQNVDDQNEVVAYLGDDWDALPAIDVEAEKQATEEAKRIEAERKAAEEAERKETERKQKLNEIELQTYTDYVKGVGSMEGEQLMQLRATYKEAIENAEGKYSEDVLASYRGKLKAINEELNKRRGLEEEKAKQEELKRREELKRKHKAMQSEEAEYTKTKDLFKDFTLEKLRDAKEKNTGRDLKDAFDQYFYGEIESDAVREEMMRGRLRAIDELIAEKEAEKAKLKEEHKQFVDAVKNAKSVEELADIQRKYTPSALTDADKKLIQDRIDEINNPKPEKPAEPAKPEGDGWVSQKQEGMISVGDKVYVDGRKATVQAIGGPQDPNDIVVAVDGGGYTVTQNVDANRVKYEEPKKPEPKPEPKKPTASKEQTQRIKDLLSGKAKPNAEEPKEEQKSEYGKNNKFFTEEKANAARERLKNRHKNRMNMGIDPEDIKDFIDVAGYHIESGVRKFADFCKAMIEDLGDWCRPYLAEVYQMAKHDPDIKKLNIDRKEWTSEDDVYDFDVENFKVEDDAKPNMAAEKPIAEKPVEKPTEPTYKEGDEVVYKGRKVKVDAVHKDGSMDLSWEENYFGMHAMNVDPSEVTGTKAENFDDLVEKNKTVYLDAVKRGGGMTAAEAEDQMKKVEAKLDRLTETIQTEDGGMENITTEHANLMGQMLGARAALKDIADGNVVYPKKDKPTEEKPAEPSNKEEKKPLEKKKPASTLDLIDRAEKNMQKHDKEKEKKRKEKNAPKNVEPTNNIEPNDERSTRKNGGLGEEDRPQTEQPIKEGVAGGNNPDTATDTMGGRRVAGLNGSRPDEEEGSGQPVRNQNNYHEERKAEGEESDIPTTTAARTSSNFEAIVLVKKLMEEDRAATPEEMKVLGRFTGWGGLGGVLDKIADGLRGDTRWKVPEKLLSLAKDAGLTPKELKSMALSAQSAYYTPDKYIDTLWDIAKKLGFKGGNILEGSAGIGRIIARIPSDINGRSNIEAVELETLTGGMLQKMYPDAQVHIDGFQNVTVPAKSVGLAITNVPFGTNMHVSDPVNKDLSKRFGNLHDFCIAKNVRALKEGGIGIFITTSGTMDKSGSLRRWVVNEGDADFIGAFRLPNNTFGGTEVTSDIIVIRKRVGGKKSPNAIDAQNTTVLRTVAIPTEERYSRSSKEYDPALPITKDNHLKGQNIVEYRPLEINSYFAQHPEFMAGEMFMDIEKGQTRFGGKSQSLYPKDDVDIDKAIEQFINALSTEGEELAKADTNVTGEKTDAKNGSLVVAKDGSIMVAQNGVMVDTDINDQKVTGADGKKYSKGDIVKDYGKLRDAVQDLLDYQLNNDSDEGLKPLMDAANKAYDEFTKKYGTLNKNNKLRFMDNDSEWPSVQAIEKAEEHVSIDGKRTVTATKAGVLNGRVMHKVKDPQPENIKDAVVASIYMNGKIDTNWIADKLHITQAEAEKQAIENGVAFKDPQNGDLVPSYQYLSGNVRKKLQFAEDYKEATGSTDYDKNIDELKKVIPADIPAHLIKFELGSTWIPEELYTDFLSERFGLSEKPIKNGSSWIIPNADRPQAKNVMGGVRSEMPELGGRLYTGAQLMEAAMNNRSVEFKRIVKDSYTGETTTYRDPNATQQALQKIDQMKEEFREWAADKVKNNEELGGKVQRIYNDRYNAEVPMKIGDEFLQDKYPNANEAVGLYAHQKKAVMRSITSPVLFAHEAGTGKTFTMITSAMEMRRLGLAKKPMIVVQNATVGQFAASAKFLYPNAKVMVMPGGLTPKVRKNRFNQIRYNDFDIVIMSQSVFNEIPDSQERRAAYINEKIEELNNLLVQNEVAKAHGGDAASLGNIKRDLENQIKEQEEKLAEVFSNEPKKKKGKSAKDQAKAEENAKAKAENKLNRKVDDVVSWDEFGIDALFVDEAHYYKKLGYVTAMTRGVKGIDSSSSERAVGAYLKMQSVLEASGGKNVVLATGTPISNTAGEMWTFMRYLMPVEVMKENDVYYFDDFVRNFGKVEQSLEFKTNGKFDVANRFGAYQNVPELIRLWNMVADTVLRNAAEEVNDKLPDVINGKGEIKHGVDNPTDIFVPQNASMIKLMRAIKAELARFDAMDGKEKKANSSIPLVMFGLAKRAAIDPRLVMKNGTDEPTSKVNRCVDDVIQSLGESSKYNGTVAIFCEQNTRWDTVLDGAGKPVFDSKGKPKKVAGFNVFEDIKKKLMERGVPEDQIAIIKSGMKDTVKEKIFEKVNSGEIRVVMGNKDTLGTGVNIQERLYTIAHLDVPERPSDYEQENARGLRQGNMHKEWGIPIKILRYGVEDTLDVTGYQRLAIKSKFIGSIMNGNKFLEDTMHDRTLEEDDDVFGDTVAQLSGSQYALLKTDAEKKMRKYANEYKSWQADQIYVEAVIKKSNETISSMTAFKEKNAADRKNAIDTFGDKLESVVINGVECKTEEEQDKAWQEINKQLREFDDKNRNNPMFYTESLSWDIEVNGVDVKIQVDKRRTSTYVNGAAKNVMQTKVSFDSPIGHMVVDGQYPKGVVTFIKDRLMSGAYFDHKDEAYDRNIEEAKKNIEIVEKRRGEEFQYSEELELAKNQYEEYSKLMKEELDEKEAKYADKVKEETIDNIWDLVDGMDDGSEDTEAMIGEPEEVDLSKPFKGESALNYAKRFQALYDAKKAKDAEARNEALNNLVEAAQPNTAEEVKGATKAVIEQVSNILGKDGLVFEQQEGAAEKVSGDTMAFSKTKEDYDKVQEDAAKNTGVVLGGLGEAEVYIISGGGFDFEGKRPSEWADENLVTEREVRGKTVYDEDLPTMNDGTPYSISRSAIGKYLSGKTMHTGLGDGYDKHAHVQLLPVLKDVIKNSVDAEIHPDYRKVNGVRSPRNGYNKNILVHRLYGAATIDGKMYRVKTTMQEFRDQEVGRPHAYEVTEIELIDNSTNSMNRSNESVSVPFVTGAKLLKDVEKSYDSGKKLLGESRNNGYLQSEGSIEPHLVTDKETLEWLNNQPTKKVYRAMQVIDGKLYPPMAARVGGEMVEGRKLGEWEQADEHPELIKMVNGKPKFVLDKGGNDATGKKATSVPARYNPYWHTSDSPLNDQFKSAWIRPNMVTVEVEIPESELTSGYKAEHAKDAVGAVQWKSGVVTGEIVKRGGTGRTVYLSRWDKPVRILDEAEVAELIKEKIGNTGVSIPENTVTPKLRAALENAGVPISEPEKGVKKSDQIQEALERGLEIDNSIEAMRLSDGQVYGWVDGDDVMHLTPKGVNPETPLHEYSHLWLRCVINGNNKMWEHIKKLMKDIPAEIWNEVRKNYPHLSEEGVYREVFGTYMGKRGRERMEKDAAEAIKRGKSWKDKAFARDLFNQIKRAIEKAKSWIAENILGMDPKRFKNIDDVFEKTYYDFANGFDPRDPNGRGRKGAQPNTAARDKNGVEMSIAGGSTSGSAMVDEIKNLQGEIDALKAGGDVKAIARNIDDFIKNRMSPSAAQRLGKRQLQTIVKKINEATTADEMREPLRTIQRVINEAQEDAQLIAMGKLLAYKSRSKNAHGIAVGSKIDADTQQILGTIRSMYANPMKTVIDAELTKERSAKDALIKAIRERIGADRGDVVDKLVDDVMRAEDPVLDDMMSQLEEARKNIKDMEEQQKSWQEQNVVEELSNVQNAIAELNNTLTEKAARGETPTREEIVTHDVILPLREKLAMLRNALMAEPAGDEAGGVNYWKKQYHKLMSDAAKVKPVSFEVDGKDGNKKTVTIGNQEEYDKRMKEAGEAEYYLIEAQEKANKLSAEITERLQDLIGDGRSRWKAQQEAERTRKKDLIRMAVSEIKDKPLATRSQKDNEKKNESYVRRINELAGKAGAFMNSFDYVLQRMTPNARPMDGKLYDYFMKSPETGVVAANDKYKVGVREITDKLIAKSKEIFGMDLDDAIEKARKEEITIHITAANDIKNSSNGADRYMIPAGEEIPVRMDKDHALYLWAAWRQTDGRMKMEHEGWTDADMAMVEKFLGKEWIAFGEYITEELLPELRDTKYAGTYRRLFNTDMARIDHYFPLRIEKNSLTPTEPKDNGNPNYVASLSTPNIIERKHNVLPLDADARFSDILKGYIDHQEHWNALAPVIRDLNTLITSPTVKAMLEANEKGMYEVFYRAAQTATESQQRENYHPVDAFFGNSLRYGLLSNIAFNFNSALKQILSFPAFWAYRGDAKYMADMLMPVRWGRDSAGKIISATKWCEENIPAFKERMEQNNAGLDFLDVNNFETKVGQFAAKYGLWANRKVDLLTVAWGAKAVYDAAIRKHKKMGHADAHERAVIEATIAFNQSQQSSRPEFSSPAQKSGSMFGQAVGAYQNANISYGRMVREGLMELSNARRVYEYDVRHGMDENDAKRKMNDSRKHGLWQMLTVSALVGLWGAGTAGIANLWMHASNDDDEDKALNNILWQMAVMPIVYGTYFGPIASSWIAGYDYDPIAIFKDANDLRKKVFTDDPDYKDASLTFANFVTTYRYGINWYGENKPLNNWYHIIAEDAWRAYKEGEHPMYDSYMIAAKLLSLPVSQRRDAAVMFYKQYGPAAVAKAELLVKETALANNKPTQVAEDYLKATNYAFYKDMEELDKVASEYDKKTTTDAQRKNMRETDTWKRLGWLYDNGVWGELNKRSVWAEAKKNHTEGKKVDYGLMHYIKDAIKSQDPARKGEPMKEDKELNAELQRLINIWDKGRKNK